MVKFSKQLESQLVPEWKSAFCNYWQLKKELKQIKLSQPTRHSFVTPRPSVSTLSFNNLTRRRSVQKDVILVHLRHSVSNQPEDYYETEFVDPAADGDVEKAFFATLDLQLNKVNQFYRRKESLLLQRGEDIKLQLEKLMTMRKVMKLHQGYAADMNDLLAQTHLSNSQQTEDDLLPPSTILIDTQECVEVESGSSGGTDQDGFYRVAADMNFTAVSPIELDIPKENPALSLSAVVQMLWDDVLRQSKNGSSSWRQFSRLDRKKIQYADKMLRVAFIELYRGLGLLRSFSYLNMIAFTKILKKYDKITGRDASITYMKVVERAYFHGSDKVVKMMDEVEKIFTNYFTQGDHKKAMTFLRPIQQKSSHTITFFLGIFIGCSVACLLTFGVLLHLNGFNSAADSPQETRKNVYMDTIFPVFSFLSLVVLHLYMYGWNLFMWREKRINYAFIFEFATNTELKYREVLLVASGLTMLVVGGLLGHFIACMSPSIPFNTAIIPLLVLMVFLFILFLPFDICYRSSRYFFLASLKHIVLSPLYKVVMADFFLADQLTSQVYMFKNAEYLMCYYVTGHLKRSSDACTSDNINYQAFTYLISLLPYWWRIMQCFRRWIDEHDKMHAANGGKYLSATVAAAVSLTYHNEMTKGWMAMSIICSTLATAYQLYWDFVIDWGLLRTKSKNYLLRDQLVLERKSVYFVSMVLNSFLRLAWLQSITRIEVSNIDRRITNFLFASLEVIRRGHWNFYRLENEHLNNVGKFRAIKTVPLPFRAIENDA
ncbi:hypothetical protein GOP47_0028742 [Adiantum capillus-veneris]|nr:hypothetical protein GOP47_0028275 [Adiantum capillus-veneris]KAI5056924.1 hypothetical protein GOP47_0028742 [Adiantum capillus-veneris]